MLEEFARRNGLPNPTHFTDDGVSGTRFDRPGFLAMMEEVEAGRVEAIVIKDMSRLGRDYLKVGQVMEILRQRGVRLIAINDGVDSLNGDDDFTPFRNIMNEFYARDTSRKIRSVFKSKGMLSNGQEDENGILFVCFPVTAIAAVLSRSPMTVKRSLNELENAGLIMRVRQGVGEPNRIYVLIPGKEDAALA